MYRQFVPRTSRFSVPPAIAHPARALPIIFALLIFCGAILLKLPLMRAGELAPTFMDAFFASVEQRDNPAYRGKPLAVGGSPESRV